MAPLQRGRHRTASTIWVELTGHAVEPTVLFCVISTDTGDANRTQNRFGSTEHTRKIPPLSLTAVANPRPTATVTMMRGCRAASAWDGARCPDRRELRCFSRGSTGLSWARRSGTKYAAPVMGGASPGP
jgi:hypothetical protein